MSERVKLNCTFEPEFETIAINGQEIKVYKRIPYVDKIACAEEYASMMCVVDLDQELAYEAYEDTATKIYCFLKWYTNIDMEEYAIDYGAMMDAVSEQLGVIEMIIGGDGRLTDSLMNRYLENTISIYNQQHSLAQKAKLSLRGILNGEDLVKGLSESRLLNEEMIDLLAKARERDEQVQNVVAFPWAAKKGE